MRPRFRGSKEFCAACIWTLLVLARADVRAQTSNPPSPAFDVVSIHQLETTHSYRNALSASVIGTPHKLCNDSGNRVLCQLSLHDLLEEAFQVKRYEITGPPWLADDLFLFEATMPPNTDKATARLMLQHALKERFGLSSHFEQREIACYAMIPAKGGTKLQPADDAEHRKLLSIGGRAGAYQTMSSGQFSAVAISLESLALNLQITADLDRPVINMTGLSGNYKVDLHWHETEDPQYTGLTDPNFRIAVKDQLGLDLEKRQIPMNVLIIDHINRTPSEN